MKNHTFLQAHRGVASEYPENTMSAFRAAMDQDYEFIEFDTEYTSDMKFVALHDSTINRTGRNKDGSEIGEEISIRDITYEQACEYDYGVGFSLRFKGEKIPLVEEVLALVAQKDIVLKIDNKIQNYPDRVLEEFLSFMHNTKAKLAFTCKTVDFARRIAKEFPDAQVHYDGPVSEETLRSLTSFVSADRLVVWIAYPNRHTEWVRVPKASEELCALIRNYAKLGVWIVTDYDEYKIASEVFGAYVVETNGVIKPIKNQGFVADMHTHSKNSHDSECDIEDMIHSQLSRGINAFAVTDHCDLEHADCIDVEKVVSDSFADAVKFREKYDNEIEVLCGVEIGKGYEPTQLQDRIVNLFPYDVIIGSVHTFEFEGDKMPYSKIDFSQKTDGYIRRYIKAYFEHMKDMLRVLPCDVLAHLTCPFRYINGKYSMNADSREYEEDINFILEYIISHGIALEINTSGIGGVYGDYLPEKWIIEKYRSMGGYLITLGSDAHVAVNAATGFEQTLDYLRKVGFENIYYYKNRINIQCKL